MARIVITEFMDEAAVAQLRAAHDVLYDPKLVDDPVRLHAEAAGADAIVVRNRTQVRGELLAALTRCGTAWSSRTRGGPAPRRTSIARRPSAR